MPLPFHPLAGVVVGVAVLVSACGGQTDDAGAAPGAADPCAPEPSDDSLSSCLAWQESGAQSAPVVLHFTLADPASATNVVSENVTMPDGTGYALSFSVASSVGTGASEAFPITKPDPDVTFGPGNTSLSLSISSCSTSPAPSCDPSAGECVPSNEPTCANGAQLVETQAFYATGGDVTCDASSTRQACRFTNLALTFGGATGVVSGWVHTPK